eukprot:6285461-Karenia_brevis.AAC.1
MDNPHCLTYLDGRPSLPWTTLMHDLHCQGYLDGRPSLPELPGWATFTAWTASTDDLQCLDYVDMVKQDQVRQHE